MIKELVSLDETVDVVHHGVVTYDVVAMQRGGFREFSHSVLSAILSCFYLERSYLDVVLYLFKNAMWIPAGPSCLATIDPLRIVSVSSSTESKMTSQPVIS